MSTPGYPIAPDPNVPWTGALRRYDLIKEVVIATLVVLLLTIGCSLIFSSPDDKPVTIASWSAADPGDFLTTAVSELNNTSGTATYGPPYTHVAGSGQNLIGGISLQRIVGVHIPIKAPQVFVLDPLHIVAQTDPALTTVLGEYESASTSDQTKWTDAYTAALPKAIFKGSSVTLPAGHYGPVGPMMSALLAQARAGGLDGALISSDRFYQSDFTRALLFLADGGYLESLAGSQHLQGSQWGMMNETGNYPGQAWLWLYTFWYQVPPFSTSDNADAQIWGLMALFSAAFICIPFIPGLRSIPRAVPVYRLIWRDYYRRAER